jgi:hypothetical protein
MCASYIHIDIEIDNEGRFETKLYYKGDDFSYPIMNLQFIYKATLHQHLHMEYISVHHYGILSSVVPIMISLNLPEPMDPSW